MRDRTRKARPDPDKEGSPPREVRVKRRPKVTDREVEQVEKGEDPDPNPLAPPVNIQGGG